MVKPRILFPLLLTILLASCAPKTPSARPPVSATPIPATAAPPSATPTESPLPTPTPVLPARAQYTFDVLLDYAAKSLTVRETILYPNRTDEELSDILLAVEPNLWANCFSLESIQINGAEIRTYTLDGHALDLFLPAPLEPHDALTLELRYDLALPKIDPVDPTLTRPRIFGYTSRQINLTNWYPFIVPRQNGEWILHPPWYYGEHLVYEAADYDLALRFADESAPPVVASSGAPTPESGHYHLESGRAFVLSLSPEFRVLSETENGVTVSSYYLFPYETPARAVLETTLQALRIYSETYGAYPHTTLSAVQGDFNDGMEYSAFYFLPRDFYNLYDGTDKNYLTFVAAHETSHQWWFEQVANDQALFPWLDEALATYSEHIYYETADPSLLDWWWAYRMYYYDQSAYIDIPVYDGGGFQPYTNAVYFRGAHFLDELRARIGDDAFFAFLQDYLAQERGSIATPQDFFRILREHTDADFSDITARYFKTPIP
jgi:hypothetical protein